MKDLRWTALIPPLAVFVFACTQTAAYGPLGKETGDLMEYPGWFLLAAGPVCLWLAPLLFILWMANALFAMSVCWILEKFPTGALAASGAATLLSLTAPFVMLGSGAEIRWQAPLALLSNDGINELRLGYALWVGSHLLMLLAAACQWCVSREAAPTRCPIAA